MADEHRTESGSQPAGDNRPRPRPPSWFKSETAPAAPSAPSAPPPPVKPPAPPSDEILLGPPSVAEEEVLPVPAAPPPPEVPEFVPPPPPRVQAPPPPSESPAAPEEELPDERIRAELDQLSSIVYNVESLGYLKPRLARIRKDGCSQADLMGLYRIVSQALLDYMLKQAEVMSQVRTEYERRLKEEQEMILFQAGKDLMKSLKGGGSQQAAAPPPPPPEPSREDNAQSAVLRKQIEIKDEMLMEAQERYEKLVRDVQNIRNRQEKDLAQQLHRAKEALFRKLLPVLDSFDQAAGSLATTKDVEAVVKGVEGIHRLLLDACTSEGLAPVEAKGEPFDPHMHEAMGHVATSDIPEDHVYDEVRRGYMLGEKLLRASMVRLARGAEPGAPSPGPKPPEAPPAAPAAEERPLPANPSDHPGPAPGPAVEPAAAGPEGAAAPETSEMPAAGERTLAQPAAEPPAPRLPLEPEETLIQAEAAQPPDSALRAAEHDQTVVESQAPAPVTVAPSEPEPNVAEPEGAPPTEADLARGGPEPSATSEPPKNGE